MKTPFRRVFPKGYDSADSKVLRDMDMTKGKAKILIVDDEPDIVTFMQDALTDVGYDVITAYDGDEVFTRLADDPDLIILDVMMPGMDGFTVCQAIRKRVDCPILFLSARRQETDRIRGLLIGGDDYLVKPIGAAELKARVQAHLRREKRQKRGQLQQERGQRRHDRHSTATSRRIVYDGRLVGLLIFSYRLSLWASDPSQRGIVALLIGINLLAPFVFFFSFTLLFGRRLSRRLQPSVESLVLAAERIEARDLDFTIDTAAGVAELAQLNDAFEQMRAELHRSLHSQWRSEQQRREMVAAVVHDLQTPLTVISGLIDNLQQNVQKRGERLDGYLRTMHNHTDRIIRLIDDMEQLVELERPDFTVIGRRVFIKEFFRQKGAEYEAALAAAGIHFAYSIDVPPDHDGVVIIDEERLDQIVTNLTENSLRFTPAGATSFGKWKWPRRRCALRWKTAAPAFRQKICATCLNGFIKGTRAGAQAGDGPASVCPSSKRSRKNTAAPSGQLIDRRAAL